MKTSFPSSLLLMMLFSVSLQGCLGLPSHAEPSPVAVTPQIATRAPETAPTPVVQATSTPVFVDESECRAACHTPDPGEEFAQGARPQPADHKDYKTCVECHSKLSQPVYPASHTGRMDPACPLCHVRATPTK